MYIECFFFFMLFQNSRLLFFCVVFVFFKKWFVFCIGFRFCFTFCYSLEVGLRHFTILYGTFISFIVMVLGITWPVAENFEAQQLMFWRPAASNDSKDLFWWALYSSTWWTALPWTATAVKPAVSIPHCTGLLWQECRVDLSACCKKNSGANVWLSR